MLTGCSSFWSHVNALGGRPILIPGIEPQPCHGDTWPNPGFRGNLSSGNCVAFGENRERVLDSSQTCYLCSILQLAVSWVGVFSSRIATERMPSNQGEILISRLFPSLKIILNSLAFPLPSLPLPVKFTHCIRLHTHAGYKPDLIYCPLKKFNPQSLCNT